MKSNPSNEVKMPTPINALFVNQETPITYTLQHAIRKKSQFLKLIGAPSVDEAHRIMNHSRASSERNNSTVDIVLMKALTTRFYSAEPLTLGLIKELRTWYHGPILAVSSQPEFLDSMMKAGCTHEFAVGLGSNHSLREFVETLAQWAETHSKNPKELIASFLTTHLGA